MTTISKPPRKRIGTQRVLLLRLPDESVVAVDRRTFTFKSMPSARRTKPPAAAVRFPVRRPAMPFRIDFGRLAQYLERPHLKFATSFRAAGDGRYVTRLSRYPVNVVGLAQFFKLPRQRQPSSSELAWDFLDGGITVDVLEGAGTPATFVRGTKALRFVCMFFGVQQPARLRGEHELRPLSALWEDMNNVPLNELCAHRRQAQPTAHNS